MPEPIRTMVVVNPASAGGRTGRRWPEIRRMLRQAGVGFSWHVTAAPGDAGALTRQAAAAGFRRMVAVGGDGTLNEVLNGCLGETSAPSGPRMVLGLIPSGTGSDFRRTLGLSRDPAENARLLAAGTTRTIDVGRIEFADGMVRHFINVADCGIGGEIVALVNRSRMKVGGLLGSALFAGASLATLAGYRNRDVVIEIDGQAVNRRIQQAVIANGRYFGGGMQIAPMARPDDGQFDVVVVAAMSRRAAVAALPRLYRGRHLSLPAIEVRRGRRVSIRVAPGSAPLLFDLEGEQIGSAPATVTMMAAAVRFAAPLGGRDHPG